MSYWKLFHKLLDDKVDVGIVRVSAFWYSKQQIRWHGCLSQFFYSWKRSRVSILTRDIDIANLSVRPSVRLSVHPPVRYVPVLDENGLTYRHSFFHRTVA